MVQTKSLHEREKDAWSNRAGIYDDIFAPVSSQAIDDILDSLGPLRGRRHLDVACGTGHLVAAAMARGAVSEGVDFAQPMIDVASDTYRRARYRVATATELPYDDGDFQSLTCAFGLSHMAHPEAAIMDFYRVLRPGGVFAFTLWCGPDEGNEVFAIIRSSLEEYAEEVPSPPDGWPPLQYADEATCSAITEEIGFGTPFFEKLPIVYHMESGQEMIRLVDTLSTRSKFILDSQSPFTQDRIRTSILLDTESRRSEHGISLSFPAVLAVVRKPS